VGWGGGVVFFWGGGGGGGGGGGLVGGGVGGCVWFGGGGVYIRTNRYKSSPLFRHLEQISENGRHGARETMPGIRTYNL